MEKIGRMYDISGLPISIRPYEDKNCIEPYLLDYDYAIDTIFLIINILLIYIKVVNIKPSKSLNIFIENCYEYIF